LYQTLVIGLPTDDKHGKLSRRTALEVGMADRAEAIYLDDLGNVVPREQARRVRITMVGPDGTPQREIWGVVYRPDDDHRRPDLESEYELLG
jgi:hypothetical protein